MDTLKIDTPKLSKAFVEPLIATIDGGSDLPDSGINDTVDVSVGATEPVLPLGAESETNLPLLEDIVITASALDGSSKTATIASPSAPFVPSLGAWTRPLKTSLPPSTSPLAPIREVGSNLLQELSQVSTVRQKQRQASASQLKPVAMEDDLRFPWAAKMSLGSRNLYRAGIP